MTRPSPRIPMGSPSWKTPPLVDKEGYLNLPQGPGLGVEINKDLIIT